MWGTLIVDSPTEPYRRYYDKELVLTFNDWYHTTGSENTDWYLSSLSSGRSPIPDSVLFNGRGFYPCSIAALKGLPCTPQTPLVFPVRQNDRYRIRLINTSSFLTYQFHIQDHLNFIVIEVDGVDTVPTPADTLLIAPAQRYSIVVTMNARQGSYGSQDFLMHANVANQFFNGGLNNFNQHPEAIIEDSGFPAAILRYKSVFVNSFNNFRPELESGVSLQGKPMPPPSWPVNATPEEEFEFLLRNPGVLRPNQSTLALESLSDGLEHASLSRKAGGNVRAKGRFTDFTVQVVTSPYEAATGRKPKAFKFNPDDSFSNFRPWNVLNEKDLQPYDRIPAPNYFNKEFSLSVVFDTDPGTGITYATFNQSRYTASGKPLIFRMLSNENIPGSFSPMVINLGDVVQVKIINDNGTPHPFHLHGHTFWVVGREPIGGTPTWFPTGVRRDTVVVDAAQSVYIKFVADNPGAWLFHCHINWHHQAGLAANFVEARVQAKILYRNIPKSVQILCKNVGINIKFPARTSLLTLGEPGIGPPFSIPRPQSAFVLV
jgi:FtsP/CotA-like multicopper oxidase with cupredoxin domain